MQTYRENPEGEENQRATRQHEREMFALKLQAQVDADKVSALLDKLTLIRTGNAAVDKMGRVVDKRSYPDAVPILEHTNK